MTDQPREFSPPDGEQNVWLFTPPSGRPQVGQRPGLSKVVAAQLGTEASRVIQALCPISRASAVTSFVSGVQSPLTGVSKRSEPVSGNVLVLATGKTGLVNALLIDGAAGVAQVQSASERSAAPVAMTGAIGFPTTAFAPTWTVMHPANQLAAVGFNYVDTGVAKLLVVLIDPRFGSVIAARTLTPTGNVPAAAAVFTSSGLYIAAGVTVYRMGIVQLSGRWLPEDLEAATIAASNLVVPSAVGSIIGLCAGLIDSTWRIYAAFTGGTAAGQTVNPIAAITVGACLKSFRAGVLRIDETDGVAAIVRYGPGQTISDAYAEVSVTGELQQHYTARFSRLLLRGPRGAIPTAIAYDPITGGCVVAITNDGWGPEVAQTPDGNRAPSTLIKLDATGVLSWEIDLQSRITGEAGGKRIGSATTYPCDVPNEDGANIGTTSKDGPAVRAVAVDSGGLVYAAGRISSGRFNIWCCDTGGYLRWRERTESRNITSPAADGTPEAWKAAGDPGGGTVRFGLTVDLTSSVPVFTGRRNRTNRDIDTYANEQYASTFKLQPADGSIEWAWSAVQDAAGEAVACIVAGDGTLVLGVTPFTDPGI